MALAMLIVAPQESDSGWLDRWRDKGSDPDEVLDRHVMDVPARNLHAIVDKLQQENFFRRSKPLVSESHLGVMMDDVRFAKDYRSVAETGRHDSQSLPGESFGLSGSTSTYQHSRHGTAPSAGDGCHLHPLTGWASPPHFFCLAFLQPSLVLLC